MIHLFSNQQYIFQLFKVFNFALLLHVALPLADQGIVFFLSLLREFQKVHLF